jgi:hypothetical protein
MVNANPHPWLLVGPWYRWSDPYDPKAGRASRPVFQKYDTADFANEFLKDPQHSLKFIEDEDITQRAYQQKAQWQLQSTGVRKLYLDTHKRFYLVVCELHCDMPGFPWANRGDTCDTGFVVRRRVAKLPQIVDASALQNIQEIAFNRARLAELEALPPGMKRGAASGIRAVLEDRYQQAQSKFLSTAIEYGISLELQGWFPSTSQGVGHWGTVAETPEVIDEHIWPLFPLIPDPRIKNHSSGGRTIWGGVIPTSSSDVDAVGNPRFDDRSLYEIRCFVRRHDPRCPKRRERNHCHGEFVWSSRTDSYQLAPPFDLQGTSNRPVNIILPDIPALQAQTAKLKPGQGTPVRMISPPGSNLEGKGPNLGGASICSFSIPLITIVATFLFNITLPIVVLAFGLWFLLRLKFCILPTLSLGGGVSFNIGAALGKIDAGVDFNVAVDATLIAQLQAIMDPTTSKSYGGDMGLDGEALFNTVLTQGLDFSASAPSEFPVEGKHNDIRRPLPDLGGTLVYEENVPVEVTA